MKEDIKKIVEETIERRAWSIAHKLSKYWPDETKQFQCVIAGGCLGDTINDVDLFPWDEIPVPQGIEVLTTTKNATALNTQALDSVRSGGLA